MSQGTKQELEGGEDDDGALPGSVMCLCPFPRNKEEKPGKNCQQYESTLSGTPKKKDHNFCSVSSLFPWCRVIEPQNTLFLLFLFYYLEKWNEVMNLKF